MLNPGVEPDLFKPVVPPIIKVFPAQTLLGEADLYAKLYIEVLVFKK